MDINTLRDYILQARVILAANVTLAIPAILFVTDLREQITLSILCLSLLGMTCNRSGDRQHTGQHNTHSQTGDTGRETYTRLVKDRRAEPEELPIDTVEGIGTAYAEKMRSAGINTVQDLLDSNVEDIVRICGVTEDVAHRWIAIGRFSWLQSVSQEDAEAIVYGGGILDIEELAAADPTNLYERVKNAVELGHVKMPEKYRLTLKEVKDWVAEARDLTTD